MGEYVALFWILLGVRKTKFTALDDVKGRQTFLEKSISEIYYYLFEKYPTERVRIRFFISC